MSPVTPAISLMIVECGPADVDDDRRRDPFARRQRHARDPTVGAIDRRDRRAEAELGAVVAGGVGQVVGGEHRVVDEPAVGVVERGELARRVVAERRVVDPLGRVVAPDVEPGEPLAQVVGVETLVRDADVVPQRHDRRAVVARGAEDQVAGADESRHPVGIGDAEVAGPVGPQGRCLPRRQDRVQRRVAEADDRRRCARRPGPRLRAAVDTHHRAAAPGELERDGCPDDAGADHDDVGAASIGRHERHRRARGRSDPTLARSGRTAD